MDQAASVISTANSALYVSFFPHLSAQPIPLPGASTTSTSISPASSPQPRAVFVCANSLVVSDKLVHARTRYNLRVVETLVAARVLARRLNIPVGEKEKVTLREVLGRVMSEDAGSGEDMDLGILMQGLERMISEVELLKPNQRDDGEEGVTLEEMIEWSGLSEDVFREVYLSWVDGKSNPHFPATFDSDKRFISSRSNLLPALQTRQACFHRSFACPSIPRSMPPRLFIIVFVCS